MSRRQHRNDRHDLSRPHFLADLPEVELEIIRGAARVRSRPVGGAVFLIGTATDCDLVLGDRRFPEVHSYLLKGRDGVSFRHLGSAPEATLNGTAIHVARLVDGDRIRTGGYEFRVRIRWPRRDGGDRDDAASPDVPQGADSAVRASQSLVNEVRMALLPTQTSRQLRLYIGPEHVAREIARETAGGQRPPGATTLERGVQVLSRALGGR